MGIIKPHELPNGTTGNYWRIGQIVINRDINGSLGKLMNYANLNESEPEPKTVSVQMQLFVSKEIRDAKKPAMHHKTFHFALTPGKCPLVAAYENLMSDPFFDGGVSDEE